MNYRVKIITGITGIVLMCAGLFFFVYPMFGRSNDALALQLDERKKEYENLNSEKKSIEQGQRDLDNLAKRPLQPKDFFSSDQTLVSEVRVLETIASQHELKLELRVAGTVDSAVPVPTTSSGLISVTYGMELTGKHNDIIAFLDALEHVPFVTHVSTIQMQAVVVEKQVHNVRAILSADFFVKP